MQPSTSNRDRKITPVRIGRHASKESYIAAGFAFASQLLHLWGLQEQFLFRPLTGGLMFTVAVLQGVLVAGLLFGPGRWMFRYGIALNACVVSVWLLTRFTGYPGLLGFERLPVEPANVAAVVAELAVVLVLITLHRKRGGPDDS